MFLSDLSIGKVAIIEKICLSVHEQGLMNRLEAMGIFPNRPIRVLRKGWFGELIHIRVGTTTEIALRRQEAEKILLRWKD